MVCDSTITESTFACFKIIFFSCRSEISNHGPLTEFIYYSEENDLPVDYLKVINDRISIRYRARPAYSGGTVYLDHAFDKDGNFLSFSKMDSFEISSWVSSSLADPDAT